MSNNEHTPGPPSSPWRIHRMLGGDFDAPQGERYEVFWSDDDDGVQSYTYVTAVRQYDNARLIAAAPGLLAALKRTLSMAIGHAADARGVSPAECRDFPWARDAQAAIDNATEGEEE